MYVCLYVCMCVVINRQLGSNLVVPGGARVIEAKGRLIIPGMVYLLWPYFL